MNAFSNTFRLLLFAVLCQFTAFADTNFVNVKLATGITLDLPRNWWLIQGELNKTIETSAEAVLDLSRMNLGDKKSINLIAANCRPQYMYASVRLNVSQPPLASPEDIRKLSSVALAEMGANMKQMLLETLPKQGFALRDYISTEKEEISGYPAIVNHVRRTDDAQGKQTALVRVIMIFAPGRTYRLNLAYRESEAGIWKPVIERIMTSIKIEKRMPDEK
jgi:hypothetical protein